MKNKRYELLKSQGLCTHCGKAKPEKGNQCKPCREANAAKAKEYRDNLKSSGLCVGCAKRPPKAGHTLCQKCLTRRIEINKDRSTIAGACNRCCQPNDNGNSRCDSCLAYERARALELKNETFGAYGGHCVCCGETDYRFLSIDHINNDGNKHRKEGITDKGLWRWLKKQGYPKDNFQLLCFNCNLGKRINGGICPHKEETRKLWVI